MTAGRSSMVPPSLPTQLAIFLALTAIVGSTTFLFSRYSGLPWLLPVHFSATGAPNGWQYKTVLRVFLPVLIQLALALSLGGIGTLLLSRSHGEHDANAPDVKAAGVAAEAVFIITAIWVGFQAYVAYALVTMWASEIGALGPWYLRLEWIGVVATAAVGIQAHRRLGRPTARPFVIEHWRFGQLYSNPADPALFVPTRDGTRWTLNFGRRLAVAMLAAILAVGIVGPTVILVLALR